MPCLYRTIKNNKYIKILLTSMQIYYSKLFHVEQFNLDLYFKICIHKKRSTPKYASEGGYSVMLLHNKTYEKIIFSHYKYNEFCVDNNPKKSATKNYFS